MPLVHTLVKPKRKSRYQSPWAFWSAVILVYRGFNSYGQFRYYSYTVWPYDTL